MDFERATLTRKILQREHCTTLEDWSSLGVLILRDRQLTGYLGTCSRRHDSVQRNNVGKILSEAANQALLKERIYHTFWMNSICRSPLCGQHHASGVKPFKLKQPSSHVLRRAVLAWVDAGADSCSGYVLLPHYSGPYPFQGHHPSCATAYHHPSWSGYENRHRLNPAADLDQAIAVLGTSILDAKVWGETPA